MKQSRKLIALSILVLSSIIVGGSVHAGGMSADLSITKDDGVTMATPGGQVTYTITASNAGPDDVTGATVDDSVSCRTDHLLDNLCLSATEQLYRRASDGQPE